MHIKQRCAYDHNFRYTSYFIICLELYHSSYQKGGGAWLKFDILKILTQIIQNQLVLTQVLRDRESTHYEVSRLMPTLRTLFYTNGPTEEIPVLPRLVLTCMAYNTEQFRVA